MRGPPGPPARGSCQKLADAPACVGRDALHDLGMELLAGMDGHRDPPAFGIAQQSVAAALPHNGEPVLVQRLEDLGGSDPWRLHAATSTDVTVNDSRLGTSSPRSRRSSMCRRIASW